MVANRSRALAISLMLVQITGVSVMKNVESIQRLAEGDRVAHLVIVVNGYASNTNGNYFE